MNEIESKSEEKLLGLTVEVWLKVIEMSGSLAKVLMDNIDTSIKSASRALWLSNSGGVAVLLAFASQVPPNHWSMWPLLAGISAFSYGIYLGVDMQVAPAHNLTKYNVEILKILMRYLKKSELPDVQTLKSELDSLMPDLEGKIGILTDNLVWSKRMFVFGVIAALSTMFLSLLPSIA